MLTIKNTNVENLAKREFATLLITDAEECVIKTVVNVQYLSPKLCLVVTFRMFRVQRNHINLSAWHNVKHGFLVVTCVRVCAVNGTPNNVNTQ
jgi:hypothetical protein